MKYILSLIILTVGFGAQAGTKCTYTDTTVEFVGSQWGFSPSNFYAKEGDRICVRFHSVDSNKSLTIQNTPVFLHVSKDQTDEHMITVRKVGEYTVTCNGCDFKVNKAKIIVQSAREYNQYQQKMDRRNSLNNRNRFPTSGQ